ncbi:hypothetical protein B1813_21600 [Saccharomonospora piscinae]|uniref:Uncharacterized protein n=1 Tax=Saccharomonospora piscinae TaxID=687388 RepID=A0A1V8ZX47_SACPI|nr:hypothetical protein [Saccharomonospora piscinae]OQO89527.1 hypothetical protein B1813_21600 [Saccharomonospora piscinae]
MTEFLPLWQRALTAEVCWVDTEGRPAAIAATPLLDRGVAAIALPYSRATEAAGLRTASRVAFAVTDSRSLRRERPGAVRVGTPEVVDDVEGDHFAVELLRQELVKYPPSRTLADSPLLCRENWWWLPRVIVRLGASGPARDLPARTNPERHALLVGSGSEGPRVDVVDVAVAGPGARDLRVAPLDGRDSGPGDGRALVFGHDYTMPDLERWETWSASGTLTGRDLAVTHREGEPGGALAPLRLWQRVRRQKTLERECKHHIRVAENRR